MHRLETLVVQAAPAWPLTAVRQHLVRCTDVVVHVERRPGGARRIAQIVEVVDTQDGDAPRAAHRGRRGDRRRAARRGSGDERDGSFCVRRRRDGCHRRRRARSASRGEHLGTRSTEPTPSSAARHRTGGRRLRGGSGGRVLPATSMWRRGASTQPWAMRSGHSICTRVSVKAHTRRAVAAAHDDAGALSRRNAAIRCPRRSRGMSQPGTRDAASRAGVTMVASVLRTYGIGQIQHGELKMAYIGKLAAYPNGRLI